MQQIKNLTLYHLKKEKAQYISFGIILCLTAFIINIALVLFSQVDNAYETTFQELNTANYNFCIAKLQDTEKLTEKIESIEGVKSLEKRDALYASATALDFRATEFSMNTVFYNIEEAAKLNQYEMIEKTTVTNENAENSIFLPRYISEFGEYEVGETITYQIGDKEYEFFVSGVLQEMQFGNYGSGMLSVYLTEECYEKMSEDDVFMDVVLYGIETTENTEDISKAVEEVLKDEEISALYSKTDAQTKQTRTMVSSLVVMILLVFAIIVLAVCLFLSRFRIKNMIQEDMVNLGVLKAIGYTGKTIVWSVVVPYLLVTLVAAVLGIALSYTVLGSIVMMLTLQSGFGFETSFDTPGAVVTILVLAAIVLVITYFAAGGIKKLQPIVAMRGEDSSKKVQKNYFPMDKTKGNVQFLLIVKRMFGQMRQNVLLFTVSFVMMGLVVFAGTLFYNVAIKPENFLNTLSEEAPDMILQVEADYEDEVREVLSEEPEVTQVLTYKTDKLQMEGESVTAFVCEDFTKVTNDLCYEGRNPVKADEIALGSHYYEEYAIGDIVTMIYEETEVEYEVVGFIQSVNFAGEVCEMTENGFAKIKENDPYHSFYVYSDEDTDVKAMVEEWKEKDELHVVQAINYRAMTENTREMYSAIVKIAVTAILILTTLIIFLILYVIMKSIIIKSQKELGIYKSIGYSGWQLIGQMAGSFLPVTGVAALISAVLGMFYMPAVFELIFSMVGAMKNSCEVSIGIMLLFALLQTAISFCLCIYLALPIRKISAYSLIKDL